MFMVKLRRSVKDARRMVNVTFNRSGSVSDRTISPPIGAAKPSWRQRLLLRING